MINALGQSIPAIFDVLIVCIVFWLIFSIVGVMLFRGKFFNCVDLASGSVIYSVYNKSQCLSLNTTKWYNSKFNFDNVGMGYLSLLQLATFNGWKEIIYSGVDSVDVDIQPQRESNMYNYLFFVSFIFFGSFFTLNLFVGVIIDKFNTITKQVKKNFNSNLLIYRILINISKLTLKHKGGVMQIFLTPSQKAYIKTIKAIGGKKPQKTVKRPNVSKNFTFILN